jgi:hypothetical protein
MELRAAQVSRDVSQSFFLAEAALDSALARVETAGLPDGIYQVPDPSSANLAFPDGSASFRLTTVNAEALDPDTQLITRRITATGTDDSGIPAQVSATVTQTAPLRGVWTEGPVRIWGGNFGDGAFIGDLRSALGTKSAVKFIWKVHQQGVIQIAPSAAIPWAEAHSYELLDNDGHAWQIEMGTDWNEDPGVYVPDLGTKQSTSGEPIVAQMTPAAPMAAPYPGSDCSGNITLTTPGETREIVDGNVSPPDLSGPGDGKIELCLEYLQGDADDSQVIFHAPATVYVVGKDAAGYAVNVQNLYGVPPGSLIPVTAPLIPDGVKLVVTETSEPVAGDVKIITERFAGSIYAPQSKVVFFNSNPHGTYELQDVVAREAILYTLGIPMSIGQETGATPSSPANTSSSKILSWTSD